MDQLSFEFEGETPFDITELIEYSAQEHYLTYIASSERTNIRGNFHIYLKNSDHALAVGHEHGNKVELLDLMTWKWTSKAHYPYETWIHSAPIVHFDEHFFLFGGSNNSFLPRIARYSPTADEWVTVGNLRTPRSYSGVSIASYGFVIIGGFMEEQTHDSEKCVFNNSELECIYQNPTGPTGKLNILNIMKIAHFCFSVHAPF